MEIAALVLLAVVLLLVLNLAMGHAKLRADLSALRGELGATREELKREGIDGFRNQQALAALEHELKLDRPLPPMRGWAASPDVLQVLLDHCRDAKPKTIVECGSGVSTVVLARVAQQQGGHVWALEHDPNFAKFTREWLQRYGLTEFATVLDAPLTRVTLPAGAFDFYAITGLPADAKIDLLFVDGPPAQNVPNARYPAGPLLFPRLAQDGAVFLDDAARPGEVEALQMWTREFPKLEQRPYVCEKGCVGLRAKG